MPTDPDPEDPKWKNIDEEAEEEEDEEDEDEEAAAKPASDDAQDAEPPHEPADRGLERGDPDAWRSRNVSEDVAEKIETTID